METKNSVHCVR